LLFKIRPTGRMIIQDQITVMRAIPKFAAKISGAKFWGNFSKKSIAYKTWFVKPAPNNNYFFILWNVRCCGTNTYKQALLVSFFAAMVINLCKRF